MPAQPAVSLRTLLQGSLDYAGMFPPAKLPLDAAWAKYHEAWASPHRWLLRSFVCPVGQLDELTQQWAAAPAPLGRFSAIGTADADAARLREDAALLAAFYERVATETGPAIELAYEIRPPADATADTAAWATWCQALNEALCQAEVPLADVFLEVPLHAHLLATLALPASGVSWSWGLKFRTGGTTADAFPTAAALAAAVAALAAAWAPDKLRQGSRPQNALSGSWPRYKATAGLHHPLPRNVADLGCTMHGFINLMTAAVLAASAAGSLKSSDLQSLALAILQQRDSSAFRFDARQLCWRDQCAALTTIARVRRSHFIGFGSCSFDEPIEDLQSLGWI